jgi:hypothetical protein
MFLCFHIFSLIYLYVFLSLPVFPAYFLFPFFLEINSRNHCIGQNYKILRQYILKHIISRFICFVSNSFCFLDTVLQFLSVFMRSEFLILIRGRFQFNSRASRPVLGPTQPPIQQLPGALSLGIKWPGRETDHSPHLVQMSRMRVTVLPLPQYAFIAWCSVKAQGQFYHLYRTARLERELQMVQLSATRCSCIAIL